MRAIDYDFSGPLQFESSIDALPLSALASETCRRVTSILGVINAAASGTFANRRLDAIASLRIDGLGLVASFEGDEVSARFEKASAIATIVDNRLIGEFEFRLDKTLTMPPGASRLPICLIRVPTCSARPTWSSTTSTLASFFVPGSYRANRKDFRAHRMQVVT